MKEYKTILSCNDETLNKMALARWRIEHMQFEDGVLRVVFSRGIEPAATTVISDSAGVATSEPKEDVHVLVGVSPDIYRLKPMYPIVYPQNLIEVKPHHRPTVEERKEQLDRQLLDSLRAYWDEVDTTPTPSRPLLLLGEVSNG
jgi:hypothetical protein